MFKRLGVLALTLAGSLAVLTPTVAQARDWDDHRNFDRREYRQDRGERPEYRRDHFDRREYWQGQFDARDYRYYGRDDRRYHAPIYFDRWGRPCR
jgi:hypothetical protein